MLFRSRLAAWGERASRFKNDASMQRVAVLTEWAAERGKSILELAMSWLLANELVSSVICGATKPEQVRANVAAATWTLSAADLADLDATLASHTG